MSLSHRGVGNTNFDRTQREPRLAIIRTTGNITIRGTVYLVPNTRFSDLLERDTEAFLAVTSAMITTAQGVDRAQFVAVNKAQIVTLEDMGGVEEVGVAVTEQAESQARS